MLAVSRALSRAAGRFDYGPGFRSSQKLVSFSESPRGMVQDVLEGTAQRRPCATGAHTSSSIAATSIAAAHQRSSVRAEPSRWLLSWHPIGAARDEVRNRAPSIHEFYLCARDRRVAPATRQASDLLGADIVPGAPANGTNLRHGAASSSRRPANGIRAPHGTQLAALPGGSR